MFWLWKLSLTVENFLDYGKFPWLQKISLTVESFLDCERFSWLWKVSLIVENFLDCRKIPYCKKFHWLEKLTFFVAKNNRSNNFETLSTNIFNIEQKLRSLPFLRKIKSTLYSVDYLSTNIKPLIRGNNKSLFILNQIYSEKLLVC